MSVTKAITGLVVGCLLRQEKSSQEILIGDFFAEAPEEIKPVRVWDILHHTSMIRLSTDNEVGRVYHAPNVVDIIKETHLGGNRGQDVRYSNVAVNLVNPLVKIISGTTVQSFAQESLFSPLNIPKVLWEGDSSGNQFIMAGLHLCIDDLVKIGALLFSNGRYNGQQVVPEEWIASLWSPTSVVHQDAIGGRVSWSNLWAQTYVIPPDLDDLGHPVGLPDSVSASGFGGQFIVALRRSQLLIVTQKDMELDDSRPYLGGDDFSHSLDRLDLVFSLEDSYDISVNN